MAREKMDLWSCDHCESSAIIVVPGSDEVRELILAVSALVVAGIAARSYCLSCAREAGWPWLTPETPGRRKRVIA